MFSPNTTVTLYNNDVTTDSYGDEVLSTTEQATAVDAFIWEVDHTTYNAQDGKLTTVRMKKAFLPAGTTIEKGWRVKDAADRYYVVQYVYRDSNAFVSMPIRVELERSE